VRRPARFQDLSERDRLLLHASVGRGPGALGAWRTWVGDADLGDIPYPEARLLPQVFSNLAAQELATDLPPRMRGKYRWVWSSNHLRAKTVARALRELERHGIATILLKGAALVAAERCSWGAREMGDVDILVRTAQAGAAAAVLERLGWRGIEGVDADYIARRLVRRRQSWNFEGPPSGSLDLHWRVVDRMGTEHAEDLVWRAGRTATFGDVETQWLDDAAHLVQTIEHAAHGEPAHRLVWVSDAASLLCRVDPARLRRVTSALGLRELVIEGLELAGWALRSSAATDLARRLRGQPRSVRERLLTLAVDDASPQRAPAVMHLIREGMARQVSPQHPVSSARALVARGVEPSCTRHRLVSTALGMAGRPRLFEAALIRLGGPIARPPKSRKLPPGVWIDVGTGAMLDIVGGPGWAWPQPGGSGVWAEGAEARLVLDLDLPDGEEVALQFLLGPFVYFCPNPSVIVSVNARPLAEWDLRAGDPGPKTVEVPGRLVDWCRPIEITFRPRAPRESEQRPLIFEPAYRRTFLQLRALRARPASDDGEYRRDVVAAWDDVARGQRAQEAINPLGTDPEAYLRSGAKATVELAALIGDDPGLSIVDFGAGDGRVTLPLSLRYRRVIAIDSSPAMLERLRCHCPGVETVLADGIDDVGLPTDVDVVVALAVLIHHRHADAARMIRGLTSMLRSGGKLILDLALYEIGREPRHWSDISVWTRAELEMLAADLGLEILTAPVSPGEFDGTTLGPNHGKVLVLRKR